jgi:surfeit locus 1 family protein
MRHPLLRPRWVAGHLLVLVTVVAFVSLGLWQLRRHAEVSDLRDEVVAARVLPAVPIGEADPYRRVSAVGTYDFDAETRVLRSRQGESGYRQLVPLIDDSGTAVLVDRGWTPLDIDASPRVPPGRISVEGVLWPAEPGSWAPDRLEPGMVVRRIDPAIVEPFTAYPFRDGYLVSSGEVPPQGGELAPLPSDPPEVSPGPHLSYAVQWFLFALIVVAGYPLLLRRAGRWD